VLDEQSWALLRRLTRWLDQFKSCFGRRAQVVSLQQYVHGLLGDSARTSMQAMLARVTEPVSYQAFQHFITHAPWDASRIWRRLLAGLPERRGTLILDETGFPKQGTQSVGVTRQYCGTLGKIANCQVAVTAALWTGVRAWLVGAELYLPASWLTDPNRRAQARIPTSVPFREKWRLALQLLRRARRAGLRIEAVVADAEYGEVLAFRTALDRRRLPYVLGISSTMTVFVGAPQPQPEPPRPRGGRPRTRPLLAADERPMAVSALARGVRPTAWRVVRWHNGHNPPWQARFVARRVTPVVAWRRTGRLETCWLLCQRPLGATAPSKQDKYFLSNLPPTASLRRLVRIAHQRWAIEQQYQELKTELGFDHFEGRTYPGWQHHVVLSAVTYAFLQKERMRPRVGRALTFPQVRAVVQEVFTGLLFASRPRYLEWIHQARQRRLQLRM
jgi:SRSO17 transposase